MRGEWWTPKGPLGDKLLFQLRQWSTVLQLCLLALIAFKCITEPIHFSIHGAPAHVATFPRTSAKRGGGLRNITWRHASLLISSVNIFNTRSDVRLSSDLIQEHGAYHDLIARTDPERIPELCVVVSWAFLDFFFLCVCVCTFLTFWIYFSLFFFFL